jgi:hypothetical protein
MKTNRNYACLWNALFFASCLFLTGLPGVCSAQEQNDVEATASQVKLNATIMEIDLNNNFMIVAEKRINLLSRLEKGKKIWATAFVDTNGQETSVGKFQIRDRVNVIGRETASGEIEAHTIIHLQEENIQEKIKQGTSKVPPSSLMHLNEGVWKN